MSPRQSTNFSVINYGKLEITCCSLLWSGCDKKKKKREPSSADSSWRWGCCCRTTSWTTCSQRRTTSCIWGLSGRTASTPDTRNSSSPVRHLWRHTRGKPAQKMTFQFEPVWRQELAIMICTFCKVHLSCGEPRIQCKSVLNETVWERDKWNI